MKNWKYLLKEDEQTRSLVLVSIIVGFLLLKFVL